LGDGIPLSSRFGPLEAVERISRTPNLTAFDCGNPDFNDYIQNEAFRDFREGYSVTYLGIMDGKPAAFVTLVAAAYRTDDFFEPDDRSYRYRQIPAIKIARIAADRSYQRSGCGRALVKYAHAVALRIRNDIGCRLLVADVLPERISWYEKMGFELSRRVVVGEKRSSYPMHTIIPPPDLGCE
jgi:GNAT superfamily N-acetyltransferase